MLDFAALPTPDIRCLINENMLQLDLERVEALQLVFCRGGPMSAGWNNTAAANVVTSEIASSWPMLDVPG